MQVRNNLYNIVFILIIAIFFSSILAVTSYTLKDKQRLAEEEDIKKNILKVAGILDYEGKIIKGAVSGSAECSDINCLYKNNIKTIIFDSEGKKVEDKNINPLTFDIAKQIRASGKTIDRNITLARGGWPMTRCLIDFLDIQDVASIGVKFYSGINQRFDKPHIY